MRVPQEEYEREKTSRKLRRSVAGRILEEVRAGNSNYGRAIDRYVKAKRYLEELYRSPKDYQEHWRRIIT